MPVPVEEATLQHYVHTPFIVATLKIDLNDGSEMFPSQTVMVPTELQDLSGHKGSVLSSDGLSRRPEESASNNPVQRMCDGDGPINSSSIPLSGVHCHHGIVTFAHYLSPEKTQKIHQINQHSSCIHQVLYGTLYLMLSSITL